MYPQQMSENSKMKGIDTILSVEAKKIRNMTEQDNYIVQRGVKVSTK
jgi:hypothetical protein